MFNSILTDYAHLHLLFKWFSLEYSIHMNSKKKISKKENKVEYLPIDMDSEFNTHLQHPVIIPKEDISDLIIDKDEWPELDQLESDENVDE